MICAVKGCNKKACILGRVGFGMRFHAAYCSVKHYEYVDDREEVLK